MGTFGHKIFDNDFALDVRDAYLDYLFDGLSSTQATAQLEGDFAHSLQDSDDGPYSGSRSQKYSGIRGG